MPVLWAAFLTLLIGEPWLAGGYLFGTDWPGPRRFDFPTDVSSSTPLRAALATVSWATGGELTGKLFIFGMLFLAAVMAYRALPVGGFVPRATAATVYLVNPFVYGRMHYGQLFLIAGYAALPWVALRLRRLLLDPGLKNGLVAGISLVLVGIMTPHLFLIAWVMAGVLAIAHSIYARRDFAYLMRLGRAVAFTALIAVAASAFWIVPLVTGHGSEGALIAGTGSGDLFAYSAIPDPQLGLLPNLIGLYGFWAEGTGRFTSMKQFVPVWPDILAAILLVAMVGGGAVLRRSRDQDRLKPWVAGLIVAAAIALVLEMGVSNPITSGLVKWLDANFAVYRGMRDAGKWAALLALVYAQLVGLGVVVILDRLRASREEGVRLEWLGSAAAGLLLALPLYYGNGLLYGMHGEIQPSQYPSGWYAADQALKADSHPGRTLFLPWHEYMKLAFVRNQNAVVATPAPSFFSTPMLVSNNPEVSGVVPPGDADHVAVSGLVTAGAEGRWAEVLAAHGVKYVLLAREGDSGSYLYLDSQPGLLKVADYGSIALYRNTYVQ